MDSWYSKQKVRGVYSMPDTLKRKQETIHKDTKNTFCLTFTHWLFIAQMYMSTHFFQTTHKNTLEHTHILWGSDSGWISWHPPAISQKNSAAADKHNSQQPDGKEMSPAVAVQPYHAVWRDDCGADCSLIMCKYLPTRLETES